MRPVLVDTSLWYAMADDRDPNHPEAVLLLATPRRPHLTTNWIFGEAVTLVRGRLGHKAAVALGTRLQHRPGLQILRARPEDEEAAWGILQQYADKDFSFTDCTSFAVMRRLRIAHALAFDRHFRQMGFRVN